MIQQKRQAMKKKSDFGKCEVVILLLKYWKICIMRNIRQRDVYIKKIKKEKN